MRDFPSFSYTFMRDFSTGAAARYTLVAYALDLKLYNFAYVLGKYCLTYAYVLGKYRIFAAI